MESKAGAAPPSPAMTSLHDIVLDYVINSAYSNTAKVLAQSSNNRTRTAQASPSASPTPPLTGADDAAAAAAASSSSSAMDVDAGAVSLLGGVGAERDNMILDDAALASIDRRREILDFILSGAVVRAVAALNAHFPAVLNPTTAAVLNALRNGAEPSSHSNGASSNGAESNGAGNGTTNGASNLSPYLPQPSSSRSRTAPSTPGATAPPPSATNHTVPLFTRSSDPGHVKLNLSIQRYIEEMRSVPTQSATSSPSSSIDSLTGSTALSGDPFRDLMTMHQELHTEAMKLRPEHRAAYLQEIKDVTALLGYNNPETSILRGFLEQERRIALAQQVNAAILRSEGRPVQSHLEQIARTASAIYSTLHDAGIDPQPSWTADSKSGLEERIADQLRSFQKGGFNLHEYVWG
ncbi:uncharacterized protein LOC62_06G008531 [Vanrija pseudolonga]|uniref:CRA domain-containing protein n=1 Tax=Vanrija pseudolonga TaxID=143232 RepID=A0AAF0YI45_9TREE|nr:hypothetical protein LOC62_06G008531 [Vanrija pseudolonga]